MIFFTMTALSSFLNSPDPTLTWSKVGGQMPIGRYSLDRYNTELIIRNVQQSDEGDYMCRAANTNGNQDHVIQIDVQGRLLFLPMKLVDKLFLVPCWP